MPVQDATHVTRTSGGTLLGNNNRTGIIEIDLWNVLKKFKTRITCNDLWM